MVCARGSHLSARHSIEFGDHKSSESGGGLVGELVGDRAVVVSSDQVMFLDHTEGSSSSSLHALQVNAFVHPVPTKPLIVGQEFLSGNDNVRLEIFLVGHRIGLLFLLLDILSSSSRVRL